MATPIDSHRKVQANMIPQTLPTHSLTSSGISQQPSSLSSQPKNSLPFCHCLSKIAGAIRYITSSLKKGLYCLLFCLTWWKWRSPKIEASLSSVTVQLHAKSTSQEIPPSPSSLSPTQLIPPSILPELSVVERTSLPQLNSPLHVQHPSELLSSSPQELAAPSLTSPLSPPTPSAETSPVQPFPTSQAAPPSPPLAMTNPFLLLPINPEEKRKIFQIVHMLGTTAAIFLLPHENTLQQLGHEIEHVHPLKFLEYILLHSTLKIDLDAIRKSKLLWPRFLQGLTEKLQKEKRELPLYLPGFARSLGIEPHHLEPFLLSSNWEPMVLFLLDVKLGRITPPTSLPTPFPTTLPPVNPNDLLPPPPVVTLSSGLPASPVLDPPSSPTSLVTWEEIAMSEKEKEMTSELIKSHLNLGYYSAIRGERHVNSLWDRLDHIHPLVLLAYLFTSPERSAELNLLANKRVHNYYFTSELISFLDRRQAEEYFPYLSDFARAVQKEERVLSAYILFRKWKELIDSLQTP